MIQVEQNNNKRAFNPNEHLMQLRSKEGNKDYLPVQYRLVWFREQCPQGTIDTEEREIDLDREVQEEVFVWNNEKRRSEKVVKTAKGYARFKAIVTDGKGGRATGTKSENAASFPDYIEKAETGAIGRALAALGYGTAFAPEFSEEHRIVDSPIERQAPVNDAANTGSNGNAASGTTPPTVDQGTLDATMQITEQQISSIRKLSEYLSKAEPEKLSEMSNLDGKRVIQQLTAEYRQSKAAR